MTELSRAKITILAHEIAELVKAEIINYEGVNFVANDAERIIRSILSEAVKEAEKHRNRLKKEKVEIEAKRKEVYDPSKRVR